VGIIGEIIVGLTVAVTVAEFYVWTPILAKKALRLAVRILPLDEREERCEQWSSDLEEVPGNISKLIFAVDLIRCAVYFRHLSDTHGNLNRRILTICLSSISLLLVSPYVLAAIVAVRLIRTDFLIYYYKVDVSDKSPFAFSLARLNRTEVISDAKENFINKILISTRLILARALFGWIGLKRLMLLLNALHAERQVILFRCEEYMSEDALFEFKSNISFTQAIKALRALPN
jgi:hypothetical protein